VISLPQKAQAAFGKNALWTGKDQNEGRAAYHRAREAGMSITRSMVIGEIATYKDCWRFRRTIARTIGCCVRTVQRAFTQAKELGLIGVHRAKKGEIPPRGEDDPNAGKPIDCGWSHRYIIGRGLAGPALHVAINAARAKWITRQIVQVKSSMPLPRRASSPTIARSTLPKRKFTAAELDAELERMPPPPPNAREGPD
jgi:hypothetical protein